MADVLKIKGKTSIAFIFAATVYQYLFGFVEDKKPFNDLLVRQAIAYAIP